MTEPKPPKQPMLPSTKAADNSSEAHGGGHDKVPQVAAPIKTKYNVLPPLPPQLAGDSIQPIVASSSSTQPFPMTPTVLPPAQPTSNPPPSLPTSAVPPSSSSTPSYAAQRLAKARANLAAMKSATPEPVTSQPQDANVQLFEITHLKTIKCDVCQQKNSDILYKCQTCSFHHQICSVCVENTNPKPSEPSAPRKDWSVHAKLKNAHAAFKQPNCPHKKEDGSYEHDGVKFVVLQGKKGGMKKPRNSPRRDVLPVERNAAIARAIGKHKTTEQGRRILAMATASLERGQSPELKERIEAARARRDIEAKAQSAGLKKEEREAAWLSEGKLKAQAAKLKKSFEEDRTRRVEALEQSSDLGDRAQAARLKKNIQAGSPGAELWGEVAAARARRNVEKVKGQTQAEGRKRKADMLDEDEDGEAEDSGQAERKEEAEETSLGEENNKDEDWDEMETEAAIQNSLHDDNAPLSSLPQRRPIESKHSPTTEHIRAVEFDDDVLVTWICSFSSLPSTSGGQRPVLRWTKVATPATRGGRDKPSLINRRSIGAPGARQMKITAKRSPDCKHDRYPSIDLLAPVRSRRGEREVEDGSSDSYQPSSESTDGDDRLQDLGDRSSTVVPDRQSPRVRQKRDRAQNELQYIDSDVEGEKVKAKVEHELDSGSDPYAQDRQGIALLLQAADVVESRERAQNRSIGYDGEAAVVGEDAADRSSSPSTEDSDETSPDDASESQGRKVPLPSKRERVQKSKRPTTKKRPLPIPSERTNKRRRSERLIAASSSRVRHLRSKTHFCHSSSAEHEPKRPSNRRKHIHPTITVDATTQTDPATCANETVRARIAAIDAYHAALSRGQARPNWNQYPGVREYIQEQRARARERRRWLDRHQGGEGGRGLAQGEEEGEEEGDEGEEEEEEYDEGVEGGFWVYSQSSSEQGQGGNDKAGERKRILAAKDSQGEDVDQGEDEDEDEDPIMGPGARRCGHSRYVVVVDDVDNDDDGADDSEAARR